MKYHFSFLLAATAVVLGACSKPVDYETSDSINITSEYGNLKEIIVGIGVGKNPSLEAEWYEEALKILPPDQAEIGRLAAGLNWKDVFYDENWNFTTDPAKAVGSEADFLEMENDDLVAVLKSLGVTVYRPNEITEEWVIKNYGQDALINGFSQDFPRDNLAIIGNNVIELTLRTPLRRFDIIGFDDIFKKKCDNTVSWISMPQRPLLPVQAESEPALEGGDVVVLGRTILVGNTANTAVGSNEAGYNWLKNYLGSGYEVIRIPLVENILHLDCVLSVPKKGVAIVCKEAFVNGLPEAIKGWDLIEVSLEEASRLAVNGLPVNEQNYIMSYNDFTEETSSRLKAALEARGITVHRIYFGMHNGEGGSIRCATQALYRE